MNVVVTGGSGFIGSNLAGELAKSHDVTVIDNLSTGRIENLDCIRDRVELIQGSILDMDLLRRAFAGADRLFHQAAIPSVQRSVDNPTASSEGQCGGHTQGACGCQSLRNPEGGLCTVIVGLRWHPDSAQERRRN